MTENVAMILGSLILAGGRSRRMGQPKESLPLGDSTLLGHAVETLLSCTFPVMVVARDERQELPPFNLEAEITFDSELDEGPLMGLLAGLRAVETSCDAVFVTGCDTPFLSARLVDWMARQLGDHDAVMPRLDDRLQPLSAIYRTKILPTVEAMVRDGVRTPRSLAERCDTRILTAPEIDAFDPSREFLRNINSPEDYRDAVSEFERED